MSLEGPSSGTSATSLFCCKLVFGLLNHDWNMKHEPCSLAQGSFTLGCIQSYRQCGEEDLRFTASIRTGTREDWSDCEGVEHGCWLWGVWQTAAAAAATATGILTASQPSPGFLPSMLPGRESIQHVVKGRGSKGSKGWPWLNSGSFAGRVELHNTVQEHLLGELWLIWSPLNWLLTFLMFKLRNQSGLVLYCFTRLCLCFAQC